MIRLTSFVETCCCNGRQPQGVVAKKRVSRPEAVGLLLKDRKVSRFLVAPDGYGKTHVAFEYACIIFAFEHVVWIRCSSPCFMRDLDAGSLAEEVASADAQAALVVFDELPILDPKRCEALSAAVDELLRRECEVMVTCSPAADAFAMLQKDRVLITSRELLLDEAEVRALGRADEPHSNIACMAWGEGGAKRLLEGCAKEMMPADLRCAIFVMLIMGFGSSTFAFSLFDEGRAKEMSEMIMRYYTFLGLADELFDALEVGLDEVKAGFVSSLVQIASCTPFATVDQLAHHLADALLGAGRAERAYELICRYASLSGGGAWVEKRGWQLIFEGHPLSVIDIVGRTAKREALAPWMRGMRAWALWSLGSRDEALAALQDPASTSQISAQDLALALSLKAHLMDAAMDADESFAFAEALTVLEAEGGHEAQGVKKVPDAVVLGRAMLPVALGGAVEEKEWRLLEARAWDALGEEGWIGCLISALIAGAWTLDQMVVLASTAEETEPFAHAEQARVARLVSAFASRVLARAEEDERLLFALAIPLGLLLSSIERHPSARAAFDGRLTQQASAELSSRRIALERQSRRRVRSAEERAQERAAFERVHPDPFRRRSAHPVMSVSSAPQLEIRLFGGLEARIDGEVVDPRKLTRKRARTLAAALALNKGHEMSRLKLCEIVWPDSEPEMCVNSFYSIWAALKKALTFEGSCPYLVRSQDGCSLDPRYLVTDMEEFESTCASLVFGGAAMGAWEDLYAKVTASFSESLLPNEGDNPYISSIRERCKNRLVDGLLSASKRLLSLDERTGALWFSREALARDDGREDVYIALMESQIAANQRGPALETYFKCRKFLSEGLGIDPSPRLVELYRSIIEYEEEI